MGWEIAADRKCEVSCDGIPGGIWAMTVRARERGRETPMVTRCVGEIYSTATEIKEGSPSWSARRMTGEVVMVTSSGVGMAERSDA